MIGIIGSKIPGIQNDAAEIGFLANDFTHEGFLCLSDLRMPDFQLETYAVVDGKMTQENKRKLILAFFIFPFITKPGSAKIEPRVLHD
jgi:hypothetical protein